MNYLLFIPWILFFSLYSLNAYKVIYRKKTKINLKWINKNFFKIFRFDVLLLMGIFIYFSTYRNITVIKMLFFMINLYLFVNTIYDVKINKKRNIDWPMIIIYILIISIPIIYYYFTKKIIMTFMIMFGYVFFTYIINILINNFNKKILKL